MNQKTREERLRITLSLDGGKVNEYLPVIEKLVSSNLLKQLFPGEGDTLNIHYDVVCEYFNQVERRLSAINYLLSVPGLVTSAKTEEFNHGYSLIVRVAQQIEMVRQKLASRKPCAASLLQKIKNIFKKVPTSND